jgi:superfamily II DNA or RNA helicase
MVGDARPTMTLTSALAPATSQSSRIKGEQYFHSHAVVHFDPQQSMVYAVVRGSEDYVVRIEIVGTSVRGTCTCPYFNDRLQPCKHLWAVALTCDARRVVQLPDGVRASAIGFVPLTLDDERAPVVWSTDDPEFMMPTRHTAERRSTDERRRSRTSGAAPPWQQALSSIAGESPAPIDRPEPLRGQLLYVIDRAGSKDARALVVHLLRQERKQTGEWGVPKPARLVTSQLPVIPDEDREILEQVSGARLASPWEWGGSEVPSPFYLKGMLAERLLPAICRTGRCRLALTDFPTPRPQDAPLVELAWADEPYRCEVRITRDDAAGVYRVDGLLTSNESTIALADVQLLMEDGLACAGGRALRADPAGVMAWMQQLLQRGPLGVPIDQAAALQEALRASGLPDIDQIPHELQTQVVDATPTPHLVLQTDDDPRRFTADLSFSYQGGPPQPAGTSRVAPTRDPHVLARRSVEAEQAAVDRLEQLGARRVWLHWERRAVMQVAVSDLPRLVRTLVPEGWRIDADSLRYQLATEPPQIEVSSGIDWFELKATVTINGQHVPLPQLLEAVQRRDGAIMLDDGTVGILPEPWLRELAPLALGTREGNHLRFRRSQVALLDALLASRPSVSWDATAAALRARLRTFDNIPPLDPPPTFVGHLRDYQREALGWTAFLREFGFGGCLADDMGLGKTVVVLALLESRRHAREANGEPTRPSLVVVPRSVLFNWQQEAARFAPHLRVLDFSGADRTSRMHLIGDRDVVLATYGTLRRDAVALADVEFDYVVLDEAQAIKNPNTAGAKAARLLRGEHRLALSGTPVENRLADLWSLFEFLNPGLLSGATAFGRSFSGNAPEDLAALSRGLRPFILRRTKEQVAVELPPKTEQTIICDLERRQRVLYNQLRDHYRQRLLDTRGSWQRSKMQVLEALLRLRQAACHPALIDRSHAGEPSAKLDLLVPRLLETIDEGHKALVFSQFTSFLALLRTELDERGVTYEYLDGATRDREARVTRFQQDPACGLFLISLKAGGVGLNLTAADYVFILDPWWNPAAEAQAVDRTHRIGQERSVFAYRLIARDTVEERVLELQQRKRELADAIITADNSIIRTLQREDLELLLS